MRTVIGSIFSPENAVLVSTVRLPNVLGVAPYETCVFHGRDSDVAAQYNTLLDAIIGHFKIVCAIKRGGTSHAC